MGAKPDKLLALARVKGLNCAADVLLVSMTAVGFVVKSWSEGTAGAHGEVDGSEFLAGGNRTEGTGGGAISTTEFCTLSASSDAARIWLWRSSLMLGEV